MTDNIDNITFIDFETKALPGSTINDANIKTAGTYRYTKSTFAIILAGATANEPVWNRNVPDFANGAMRWRDMPDSLHYAYELARHGEHWFAAFNAGFDREVWNECTYDFPPLEPEMIIDVMAQATSSNLPPNLEGASKAINRHGKQPDGKLLINMFCGVRGWTPQDHPDEWARFNTYADQDVDEMREVFRATRPLSREDWEDYWVSERINQRGIHIDLPFAERAATVAVADVARSNRLLRHLTGGAVTKVTEAAKIATYLYNNIPYAEARELLVKEWDEEAEDDLKVGKLSLERQRVSSVLAFYAALEDKQGALSDTDQALVDILTIREFGGSTSPFKFQKMLDQHDGGDLKGSYVFNGAQQTGRYSSKGVQIHNLNRSSLGKHEVEAIEMINELEL